MLSIKQKIKNLFDSIFKTNMFYYIVGIIIIVAIWLLYKFYFLTKELTKHLQKSYERDHSIQERNKHIKETKENFSQNQLLQTSQHTSPHTSHIKSNINPISPSISNTEKSMSYLMENTHDKPLRPIYFKIQIGTKQYNMKFKLYDDVVPLTCKNFRVLSTSGVNGKTYKNSIFHRVIPEFMIQGGDITHGNGLGSISIYGEKFEDEKFAFSHNRRGLLSMANSGINTNGCQFFITYGACQHLDGKHVIFGEVIEGIEVLDTLEKTPCDAKNKPYENIKILECGEV